MNIDRLWRDTAHYNQYDIVFDGIHTAKNALAGFAHFAYRGEGVTEGMAILAAISRIDFVELLQNTQINQSDYFDYLNLGFRIAAAAGSDFPWGSTIGDGRTYVYTGKSFSADAWFEGLKNGKTFVSNGPAVFFQVAKQLPGSEIKVKAGSVLPLSLQAICDKSIGTIDRIEIYNNDGIVASKKNETGTDDLSIDISHQVQKSEWLAAAVFCTNSAVAHTSPVYIVADNKPVVDLQKAPGILKKQLKILDEVTNKENKKSMPDAAVLQRVQRAKQFYKTLVQRAKR